MNASNVSLPCDADPDSSQEIAAKMAAWTLIAVFGLLGNVLTILVVYREKSLHNTVNYLIVNMAISDLITPLIILPYNIFSMARGNVWIVKGEFGSALCKLFVFTADISPPVSILSLVCITVDRFCAIMFPLKAGTAPLAHATKLLIAFTWILPAICLSPYLYGYDLYASTCVLKYSADPRRDKTMREIFYSIIFVVYVVLPFIILTVMYTMILLKLRQQNLSAISLGQSKKERSIRQNRTKRVVLMVLAVLVVFGVCWGPLNVTVFLFLYLWEFNVCIIQTLVFITQTLAYANPVFNPIIYFIFIERFRVGLHNLLTCKKRMSPQQTVINSRAKELSDRARSQSLDADVTHRIRNGSGQITRTDHV